MKAIILAGGLGTRLQPIISQVPKPMAPIGNKPFLAYLLAYLQKQGITQVILSVHYLAEKIKEYFQSSYKNMSISYVHENEPLGTGGAIAHALSILPSKEAFFVLNGDTFVTLDYQEMYRQHQLLHTDFSIALRQVDDCGRYGSIQMENDRVIAFNEKNHSGPGLINAGVYVISPSLFEPFNMPKCFSFEADFLVPYVQHLKPSAFVANSYFIDIGLPVDYARAQLELPQLHME